ncbi:FadR/GntR family transcriptional regulator [Enemella evansiae]|nr:FadR/GntR family transcriptional regulator [Enemella evansiae]
MASDLTRMALPSIPTELSTPVAVVTRYLLNELMSGRWAPGDRLPPERTLATTLGVGRSAIREATAALEILGVAEVRPGSGTYVRDGASALLQKTLSWGLFLSAERTADLVEVREALEIQCARAAALHITDDQLSEVREHLATMRDTVDDHPAFVQADSRFHELIDDASGNAPLRDLVRSVRALLRVWVERALNEGGHARLTVAEHQAVVDALATREPDKAEAAMRAHMGSAGQRLRSVELPQP